MTINTRERELAALPPRESFELAIEQAEAQPGQARKIRGVANTFGVMRSGRILHPAAVEGWLAAHGDAGLPLLAQHGYVSTGFATIGKVTALKVARGKGLTFEAELAAGNALADEAWNLVQQKLLASISIGWVARQARYVREDDADLDEHFKKEMKRAGVKEALAFLAVELVEISLVDVPDDRGAKLAAKFDAAVARIPDLVTAAVSAGIAGTLRAEMKTAAAEAMRAAQDEALGELRQLWEAMTDIAIDPRRSFAELLDDVRADDDGEGCAVHGTGGGSESSAEIDGLRKRLENV